MSERSGLGEKSCFHSRGVRSDATCGMVTDPLQNIDEVNVRIDAVQAAGNDQTLDDADMFGTEFGPAEVPVFTAHRNNAQGSLQMVGVDRHIRIGEKNLEPNASFARVVQGFDKRVRRRKILTLKLPIDPLEEQLHERFNMGQSVELFRLADELAIADLIFNGVHSLDLLQGLGGARGLRGQRLEEASPRMAPAQGMKDAGLLGVLLVCGIAVGHKNGIDRV